MSDFNPIMEKRWHPYLEEWVLFSTKTQSRPWSGEVLEIKEEVSPEHDPQCYLCPGVTRASGQKNPSYKNVYSFINDFASLSEEGVEELSPGHIFEKKEKLKGICKVICFSPKHNLTLTQMSHEEILNVIDLWQSEYQSLMEKDFIENVLIFENRGKEIGVSNPHPHGQIYATDFVPKNNKIQSSSFLKYYEKEKSCMVCDLLKREKEFDKRIVFESDSFICFVPYFSRYPYETHLVPKNHRKSILELDLKEKEDLSKDLKRLYQSYDNLFKRSFPNITTLQNPPKRSEHYHFHLQFYPPLRSADKMKYFAGFESGTGNIVNPIESQEAALHLRKSLI